MYQATHAALCEETRSWFATRKQVSLQNLFYEYFTQARSGCFKRHFSVLLDDSLASLVVELPPLSSSLAAAVGEVTGVSEINIRKVFGLLIYWLTQSHNQRGRDIPDKNDFLDIVHSIMGDDYVFIA